MSPEQIAAIERLRELEKKATPGEWVVDEAKRTFNLTKIYAPSDFVGSNFINKDADLICALRNDGMPLIEALQQSLSEAQADARVFSGSYNALAEDFGRLKEENERLKSEAERTDKAFSKTLKDLTFSKRESKKFCDLMMKNVNKCCEFQDEIERLREGIGRALAKMKGIADCAEQLEESAEQEFFGAIEELEALHDA